MNVVFSKRVKVWGPLAVVLMLCGCASISEHTHAYLGSSQFLPTRPERVRLYAVEPQQPKERLGEVILSIEGNPSRQKVEQKLKVAAARLGADGVFIVSDKTRIYQMPYWDYYWGPGTSEDWQRLVVGVAFKDKGKL